MFERVLLTAVAALLVSCEPAPISAPSFADAEESWEVQPDWPRLPEGARIGRVLGVAVDARGRVWFSHTGSENGPPGIVGLDPERGEIVASIDASDFDSPHALAWDDEGHLWVTDDGASRVVVLDENGVELRRIGGDE